MVGMEFEWDPKKAISNLRKHKVSFEEASTALRDTMAATGADPDHSIGEFRYVTFGISERGRLLVVAHTEQSETIRIISARLASRRERKINEEGVNTALLSLIKLAQKASRLTRRSSGRAKKIHAA